MLSPLLPLYHQILIPCVALLQEQPNCMLYVALLQSTVVLLTTAASHTRKHSLPLQVYNSAIYHTEVSALAAQAKIFHLQHSLDFHHTHLFVCCNDTSRKTDLLTYSQPSTRIGGDVWHWWDHHCCSHPYEKHEEHLSQNSAAGFSPCPRDRKK